MVGLAEECSVRGSGHPGLSQPFSHAATHSGCGVDLQVIRAEAVDSVGLDMCSPFTDTSVSAGLFTTVEFVEGTTSTP
jgi:hypothetical protein